MKAGLYGHFANCIMRLWTVKRIDAEERPAGGIVIPGVFVLAEISAALTGKLPSNSSARSDTRRRRSLPMRYLARSDGSASVEVR